MEYPLGASLPTEHVAFVSQIEPKNVNEALNDSNWVISTQD